MGLSGSIVIRDDDPVRAGGHGLVLKPESLPCPAGLGPVPKAPDQALEGARRVPHGARRAVGPEAAPVLADGPVLLRDHALCLGPLQLALRRPPPRGRRRRKSARPGSRPLVTQDALGPLVSALDAALGGEHDDRVVLRALQEQAEAL